MTGELNSRSEMTDKRTSKLGNRYIEITQTEKQKGKNDRRNTTTYIMGVSGGKEKTKGRKHIQ